jgi:membrane-bound lytic murein transglycosylase B
MFPLVFLALFLVFASAPARADYTTRPEVTAFIEEIAARNKLDTAPLYVALSRAIYNQRVIDLIQPPPKRGVRSWRRYRSRFLDRLHVEAGLEAWSQYEHTLAKAEKQYGVPAEIILGILGVETIYGRNTGTFETLSALTTLAFDYPPRQKLFRAELEALFLLAHEQKRDPASYTGSFAGALGWPQFLPSSVRAYAVDFDGDGKIDFDSDAADAIGSIANYLRAFGWVPGALVAERARLEPGVNPAPLLELGFEPQLTPVQVLESGVRPLSGNMPPGDATLIDLDSPGSATEYWLGYRNFYAITRYNHSNFYAMAVFQLAQALRDGHDNPDAARSYATPERKSARKSAKASKTKKAKAGKAAKSSKKAKSKAPAKSAKQRKR